MLAFRQRITSKFWASLMNTNYMDDELVEILKLQLSNLDMH